MHSFWAVLIIPGCAVVTIGSPRLRRPWLWAALFTVAVVAGIALVGREMFPTATHTHNGGVGQRMLIPLIVTTDIPVVQTILGCVVGLAVSWLAKRNQRSATDTRENVTSNGY